MVLLIDLYVSRSRRRCPKIRYRRATPVRNKTARARRKRRARRSSMTTRWREATSTKVEEVDTARLNDEFRMSLPAIRQLRNILMTCRLFTPRRHNLKYISFTNHFEGLVFRKLSSHHDFISCSRVYRWVTSQQTRPTLPV